MPALLSALAVQPTLSSSLCRAVGRSLPSVFAKKKSQHPGDRQQELTWADIGNMLVPGTELSSSLSGPGTAGRKAHVGNMSSPGWGVRAATVCQFALLLVSALAPPMHPICTNLLFTSNLHLPRPPWLHSQAAGGDPGVGPGPAPCARAPSPAMWKLTGASTVLYGVPSLHPCSSPRLHGRKLRLGEGALGSAVQGPGPSQVSLPSPSS